LILPADAAAAASCIVPRGTLPESEKKKIRLFEWRLARQDLFNCPMTEFVAAVGRWASSRFFCKCGRAFDPRLLL